MDIGFCVLVTSSFETSVILFLSRGVEAEGIGARSGVFVQQDVSSNPG